MKNRQRIAPCLWFDGKAEEAVKFYTSIFKNSKVTGTSRYGEAGQEVHGQKPGTVLTMSFELDGQEFTALNGGPEFQFTEAMSLQVFCDTQQEIDDYWAKLGKGGDPNAQQCGWLKDKFGVSWQIVPRVLSEMITGPDRAKSERVMEALMPMKKLDMAALQRAYDG